MNNQNNKKVILTVMFVAILTIVVIGTSFAFFNYTRTGSANTLKVGRISFNHTQDGNITLTNIFPMSSEEFENGTIDSTNNVTINIEGDTTYPNGVEYLVTAEDVHITVNDKRIPLTLKVTSTTDLGNNDEDYFTNRGGSTNIHKVLSGGVVVDGQYLVVGYIAPGQTGVEGSLNISAYINSDNIVISDTYDGTESDNMGTTNEWVGNKTVFTTNEWNSLSGSSNSLSFKIRVEANEGIWVDPYTTPNLMNTIGISRSANIKEIRFIEETPLRMQRRYDASVGSESDNTKLDLTYQDTGKVLAWIEPVSVNPTGTSSNLNIKPSLLINENTDNNIKQIDNETGYILYIASSGKTKWVTGSNLFNGFTSIEKITFENVDSSDVTDMSRMFYNLSNLKDVIGLNKLDTSSVIYMDNMFYENSSLTSIDLSGMGSDNLVAIGGMFYNCNNLKTIIMKNFNFGAMNFYNSTHGGYTNYYYAFSNLPNVETIDLTNANTSGVTNMYDMFYYCKKLRNIIGLNTLDTSNVTSMQYMFSECDALINLDLSSFNTSSVQIMNSMFYSSDNLESVILHGNGNGVLQDLGSMFYNCTKLKSIDLTGMGGDTLNSYSNIFYNCTSLKNINMSNFNFGKISSFNSLDDSSSIFYPLQGTLETINLSGANFSGPNITTSSFQSFFDSFTKLKSVDFSNANTSKVTSMFNMFYNNRSLENVNLANINTSSVTNMQHMFAGCRTLETLNLLSFDTSKVTTMLNMFVSCQNLTTLDLSSFDTSLVVESGRMFYGCANLTTIYVSNTWNMSSVTNSSSMFNDCTSLVGGNGTVYDSTKIDKTMAVIDTASTPGYFTLKQA